MAKQFVSDFYCGKCGSVVAVKVFEGTVRCMGCLLLYRKGKSWEEYTRPSSSDEPPPARPEKR